IFADSTSLYPTGQDITPTSPKVGIGTASPRGNLDVKAGNSGFYLLDDLNHTYPRLYFGGTDQNVAVVLNRIIPGASFFIGEDGDAGNFFVRNSGALYLGSDWNPAIYASSGNGGNVGIGTTSPKRKLHIANLGPWTGGLLITNGNGTLETGDYATQIGTGFIQMRDGPWYQSVYLMTAWSNLYIGTDPTQGNIYLGLDTAGTHRGAVYYWSINQTSDIRLKKNISTINKALDKVLKMRGILFEWKNEKLEGKHYGVIAQEIEKVLPEVVSTDKSGKKYVAYTEIIPVLIEAVKEQQKQMAGQQKQIVELKDRQKTQQKQIAKLMAQNKLLEQRLKAVEKSIKVK
ncbi:MAG: tail fiber domain-containing protein, partial [Firmicutes bacterium]|nr:tail fiber domain-containing protein [Bacillota bacterium]